MRRLLLSLVLLAGLAALGAGAYWYLAETRVVAFAGEPFGSPAPRLVSIPPGTNPRGVANLLARAGVVSDADLTYAYLRKFSLGPQLKAGEYELVGPATPRDIVEKLVRGEVKLYHFTVPEGLRVDEILPLLAASELGLKRERLDALAASKTFVRGLGVPADSLEGHLFPDTYSFPRAATEEQVLKKMVSRTLEELRKAPVKPGVTLSPLEALTLASIVEKETGAPEERPRIACVFHNRLKRGMKLQTDPTVLYAKALRTGTWSRNITRADLLEPHPYNTYTSKGLPPGPIASPGAAAIRAALNPLDCPELFFVSRNDGTHVFCPDLKCHEQNVQAFQVKPFQKGAAGRP